MSLAYSTASGEHSSWRVDKQLTPFERLRGLLENLTSSEVVRPSWVALLDSTSANVVTDLRRGPLVPPQVEALDDIKARSGFTWDQLARVFGVGRRSMHNWMNGQSMTQEHEEVLYRFREILRLIGDSNPLIVRAALRDRARGASIVDLIADGRLEEARTVALGGAVSDERAALRATSRDLSDAVREARRDTPPAVDLLARTVQVDLPQPRLKKSAPITRRRTDAGR